MPVFIVLSAAGIFAGDLPYLLAGDDLPDIVQEQSFNALSRAGLGIRPLDLSVFLFCHEKVFTALSVRTEVLFWANITSAALDNTTLVALEFHNLDIDRAREALISLLIAGGMLIPGNIPNIVSAGVLRIGSGVWARTGVPLGLLMLGIYFAVLKFLR